MKDTCKNKDNEQEQCCFSCDNRFDCTKKDKCEMNCVECEKVPF